MERSWDGATKLNESGKHRLLSENKVEVELIPEKKGLVIKHVEYLVTSAKHQSQVERRYSDFAAMYELLVLRYRCRLIPKLPPKNIGSMIVGVKSGLVGERRRALKRWLLILLNHPIVSMDPVVQDFFCYTGLDCGNHMKTQYSSLPDEYITGTKGDEGHHEGSTEIVSHKEEIERICAFVSTIVTTSERHVERAIKIGEDMVVMADSLNGLSKEEVLSGKNSDDSPEKTNHVEDILQETSEGLAQLSIQWPDYANNYDMNVLEILKLVQEILMAHKELCDRAEKKSVISDHKKGIEKISNIKNRKIKGVLATDGKLLESTESRINAMEGILQDLESRQRFYNASVTKETEIVFQYTDLIAGALSELVKTELSAGEGFIGAWKIVHHNITKTKN